MIYRAVNNRCLVDFDQLDLPISLEEALPILAENMIFRESNYDITMVARSRRLGKASYRRGANNWEAPYVVDCSSLTKWIYGQIGLWLPRRAIQQREFGESVELSNLKAGDLIFWSGRINRYLNDPTDGVGHVGIYIGDGKVVHAANSKLGVVIAPLDQLTHNRQFRGARRIADLERCVIFSTNGDSGGRDVETPDDIKWIILENLPR